jgi:hypothetical protein
MLKASTDGMVFITRIDGTEEGAKARFAEFRSKLAQKLSADETVDDSSVEDEEWVESEHRKGEESADDGAKWNMQTPPTFSAGGIAATRRDFRGWSNSR